MSLVNSTYYLSRYTISESAVLAVTLVAIMLFSIIGGFIMLYVLYNNDRMWNSTNMLIGNLAFTSTCSAVFVMPFSFLSVVRREWTFGEGHVCKMSGFMASLLLLATIFTHTVISIDKYFAVVRPMSRAMTVKRTAILIAFIWLAASTMSLVPLVGIAHYDYNPTTLICGIGFPKNKLDLLYLLMLSVFGFVVPVNVMIYVYFRVYVAIRQHSARILAHAVFSTDVMALQKKLILTVFFSVVCFFICWSTFFALTVTAIVIKDSSKLPRGLGIAAYWTGYLNSALNPIIICSMSIRFKEGFLNVYRQFSKLFQCTCLPRGRLLEQKVCLGQSTEFTDCSSQGTFLRKQSTNGLEAVVDKRPPVSIHLQHIYNNGDFCIDKDHSVV